MLTESTAPVTTLSAVAALIQAVAWPIVAVLFLLFYRIKIASVFDVLIQKLKDAKHVNAPPPNRRWLRLRLEAGLIGHAADYTTLKSSSGVGGFCSSIYRFQTSSVTFPLVAAQ